MHLLTMYLGMTEPLLIMVPIQMDSASHTDHQGHTSGRLQVVSSMELLVNLTHKLAVLVILVTFTTLLHL